MNYFDYAATCPMDPKVIRAMTSAMDIFGNPSSSHELGWQAFDIVRQAKQHLADLIGAAHPDSLIMCSGATEATNLCLKGFFKKQRMKDASRFTLITFATEHKATLDCAQYLQQEGVEVITLAVDHNGQIDLDLLERHLSKQTALVSVMHVNNETGVTAHLDDIAALVHAHGAKLHVDGAQSVGKIPLNVQDLAVDFLSLSGHKFYGPKGIGALYVKSKRSLEAQIHGGGQQHGLRSGTLPTLLIHGLGEAARIAQGQIHDDYAKAKSFKSKLWQTLSTQGCVPNGQGAGDSPYILNIQCTGVHSEALMMALDHYAFSRGSACNNKLIEPSYVLLAMGKTIPQIDSSLRISLGRMTTAQQIDHLLTDLIQAIGNMRSMSPFKEEIS